MSGQTLDSTFGGLGKATSVHIFICIDSVLKESPWLKVLMGQGAKGGAKLLCKWPQCPAERLAEADFQAKLLFACDFCISLASPTTTGYDGIAHELKIMPKIVELIQFRREMLDTCKSKSASNRKKIACLQAFLSLVEHVAANSKAPIFMRSMESERELCITKVDDLYVSLVNQMRGHTMDGLEAVKVIIAAEVYIALNKNRKKKNRNEQHKRTTQTKTSTNKKHKRNENIV